MSDGRGQDYWRVRVDLARIQTWLFSVRRKRAAEGANLLLGELLRLRIACLYLGSDGRFPTSELRAVAAGATDNVGDDDPLDRALVAWKASSQRAGHRTFIEFVRDEGLSDLLADNPREDLERGILCRDGGHFQGLFVTEDAAGAFAQDVRRQLLTLAPGVSAGIRVERFDAGEWKAAVVPVSLELSERAVPDLPQLARCEETGSAPASAVAKDYIQLSDRQAKRAAVGEASEEALRVAAFVKLRYDYGKRYSRHEPIPADERASDAADADDDSSAFTLDLASLLRMVLPLYDTQRQSTVAQGTPKFRYPESFRHLTAGGYMAVLHLDLNGIGGRLGTKRTKQAGGAEGAKAVSSFQQWLVAEIAVSKGFHAMRRVVRRALVGALDTTFDPSKFDVTKLARTGDGTRHHRPYHLMMLGGDDVLLVMRADCALPFALAIAGELEKVCAGTIFENDPLTAGIGIVISQDSVPFSALHGAAEALAASAKATWRALPDDKKSTVVDWFVTSEPWIDDPLKVRAKSDRLHRGQSTLQLSCKPYIALAHCADACNAGPASLETLLAVADRMEGQLKKADPSTPDRLRVARSQLKALRPRLAQGRLCGELAWREMPYESREPLVTAGLAAEDDPWKTWPPSQTVPATRLAAPVLDAIEVLEIAFRGSADAPSVRL